MKERTETSIGECSLREYSRPARVLFFLQHLFPRIAWASDLDCRCSLHDHRSFLRRYHLPPFARRVHLPGGAPSRGASRGLPLGSRADRDGRYGRSHRLRALNRFLRAGTALSQAIPRTEHPRPDVLWAGTSRGGPAVADLRPVSGATVFRSGLPPRRTRGSIRPRRTVAPGAPRGGARPIRGPDPKRRSLEGPRLARCAHAGTE